MRFLKLLPLLATSLCFAAQADRLTGPIDASQMVAVRGSLHGLAKAEFDRGRADANRTLRGVSLAFKPSAAQQSALNKLLAQQQDMSSPNYHKWLTPAQFADRFGMSQSDVNKVISWLQAQGLTVTRTANSRNQVSFNGTVAQLEAAFHTEIHNYLVDGEIHYANATEPSVPAALSGMVLAVQNLHNFQPKPRAKFRKMSPDAANPDFTSHISGNHFLSPGDFATIYDVQALYTAGVDGTGQKIALTGQSSLNLVDIANFRSAAGLPANVPTLLLMPGTGSSTRCSGDEGESDLDVEWSGGVAKNASITLVYPGLVSGDTCSARSFGAFDALQYAIDQNVAPVISNSYGNCEANIGLANAQTIQGWVQQANAQGQTVVSSTGDSGAADCDFQSTSATQGFAVDIPGAIPEVTGMGGTEFNGDAAGIVTNGNASATPYWSGTSGGTDTISSALSYIPEMGWNDSAFDIANGGFISSSGGGASTFFAKPSWQTGTGVPGDGKRDMPDLALNSSADHDGYLFCSEDGGSTIVATCTSGFRDASSNLTVVGGTSAAAPTFAGILALLNQSLGATGLGNINPQLYSLAASNPSVFHDVTAGSNIVPCTGGSPSCPATAPFQFGFSAGVGYDQVTGLGSVDANALFTAWPASRNGSSITMLPSATNIASGASITFTVTVTPSAGVGTVRFSTLNNGSTTVLGTAPLNVPYPPSITGTAAFTTTALPGGTNSITATYEGDASHKASTSVPSVVTVSDFTLAAGPTSPSSVPAGQSASITLTISPVNGSTQTINFTNSTSSNPGSCSTGLPAGALCSFNPTGVTLNGTASQSVTLTITTVANMTVPSGAQAITVTGTPSGSGGTHTTAVNLTVTATNQSFVLTTNAATFTVAVGSTAMVNVTVANPSAGGGSPIPFVGATTALPLTYTCGGLTATLEISCQVSPGNGQPTSATAVTVSFVTTPKTAQLTPLGGRRIFYAMLLPGLFGIVFAAGSRTRGARLLGLIVVLGFSTLWMGACGGSGNNIQKNPGTPPGTYPVTINATTGGANPLTFSLPIMLTVQ
jgi:hypothetical protein